MQAFDAPDVIAAVRAMLIASPEIIALLAESEVPPTSTPIPAAERIYGQSIPRADVEASDTFHPPKMIVVAYGGGGQPKNDLLPLDRPAITVLAYGESWTEADRVRRAVWKRFTYANNEMHGGACLYDLSPAGGPISSREVDLDWPAFAQSYSLMTAAEAVA